MQENGRHEGWSAQEGEAMPEDGRAPRENTRTGRLDREQERTLVPKRSDTCEVAAALGSDRREGQVV